MKLKDRFGLTYYLLKKKNEYFLAIKTFNNVKKIEKYKIEVTGKENILTFIKNNRLEVSK